VLNAHRKAHKAIADAGGLAGVFGDGGVGHAGGMGDEAFVLREEAQATDEIEGLDVACQHLERSRRFPDAAVSGTPVL